MSFADAPAVGWSSGFLDKLDPVTIHRLQERQAAVEDAEVEEAFDLLRDLAPRLRDFYDRAYRSGFHVAHFGYVDHLETWPTTVVLSAD